MLVRVRFDEDFDIIMEEAEATQFVKNNTPKGLKIFDKLAIHICSIDEAQKLWDKLSEEN